MFKKWLLSIYTWPILPKEKANQYQMIARNNEWEAIQPYIKKGGKFLDVGCGSGYSMKRAKFDCNCNVFGIDPDPGGHGVGREGSKFDVGIEIITKGVSENLPFEDNSFDVVYSSHVLEHVKSEVKSLKEMKRVLKKNGVLIIGMPTSRMAYINWFTQILFLTHIKIVSFLFSWAFKTSKYQWWEIFIPASHSFPNLTILYDVRHYKVKNWKRIVKQEFTIKEQLLPALYPYPEFRQLFKLKKNKKSSSSVFFICKK